MIGQSAQRRVSLVVQVDRIVSTVLVLAFLMTGFQTGYRLTHRADHILTTSRWSPGNGEVAVSEIPLDVPVPEARPLPVWRGTDRLNVLVMGLDQRAGSALPGRTDVIMIVCLDPEQRKAAVISVPRDLWVEIPGHGEDRINSAYVYGELDGTEGAGPGLTKRTIEQNLGLTIDYYARLDFECFKRIIDVLGGVTIDVPEPITDTRYPDGRYGYMSIHIPAGKQDMNGETALQYVRARHQSSDFSRMRRQQQVLLAVRDKALRLDIIPSLPELVSLLGRAFSTDLPLEDLLGLANLASQIELGDVEFRVIDESLTVPYVAADGGQVLLPKLERIRETLGELLHDTSDISQPWELEVGEPHVLVRADASRPGLAEEVADLLRRRGYDAQAQSDGIQIDSGGTFIASRREMADTAILICGLLRVSPELVLLGADAETESDIVVTLGRSFVMP